MSLHLLFDRAHNSLRTWDAKNDYPHWITKETKAQRGKVICLRSHSLRGVELWFTRKPWDPAVFTALLCVKGGRAAGALARPWGRLGGGGPLQELVLL